MASRFALELSRWGNGTIQLAFWDSLHGADEFFVLNAEGTVTHRWSDGETEQEALVDLPSALRMLLVKLEHRNAE